MTQADVVITEIGGTTGDIESQPYLEAIRQIANEAKSVPREWINSAGNDIEQPLLDYLAPLILGESQVSYHNGLPVYMDVSHLSKH